MGLGNNTFINKHFVSFNPKLGKKNSTKLMGDLDHPYFYLFLIGEVCYCWCSHLHPNKSMGSFG
jgi:hypothetical protein